MTQLYNSNLFEFLFDFLVKKGSDFLFDRLDREDFMKVRNNSKIKKFVEHESIETKSILLSKLGMRCAFVFWDEEGEKNKKVQDVLTGYMDTPKHELPKKIVKDKVFALMDFDIIQNLIAVSKASNSRYYAVNRKYLEIKKNSEYFNTRTLVDKLQVDRNIEWYVKTIEYALGLPVILESFKIDIDQFKVLLHLYNCPNGATRLHLKRQVENVKGITRLLNGMHALNMIRFDAADTDVVTISTYGLMVLEQVISKFP